MSGHAQPQQCSLRDEELASKQKILHVRQGKASEAVLEIALATGMRRGHPWAPMGRRRSRGRHIARREIRRGDARRQRKGFGGPRWGRLVPLVITLHPSLSGTNSGTNLGQGLSVARSRFCVKASAYVAVPNLTTGYTLNQFTPVQKIEGHRELCADLWRDRELSNRVSHQGLKAAREDAKRRRRQEKLARKHGRQSNGRNDQRDGSDGDDHRADRTWHGHR